MTVQVARIVGFPSSSMLDSKPPVSTGISRFCRGQAPDGSETFDLPKASMIWKAEAP